MMTLPTIMGCGGRSLPPQPSKPRALGPLRAFVISVRQSCTSLLFYVLLPGSVVSLPVKGSSCLYLAGILVLADPQLHNDPPYHYGLLWEGGGVTVWHI